MSGSTNTSYLAIKATRGAFVALFFAWRRLYRPATACKPREVCALPKTKSIYKVIFWTVAALVFVALVFPYGAPLFY